jgi:hypothetical protein
MWILQLNDMRMPKVEMMTPVARADSREEIIALLERERVESYRDGQWGKSFRKGGPLEWFNPPWDENECIQNLGTLEEWLDLTRQKWERVVMTLPIAATFP